MKAVSLYGRIFFGLVICLACITFFQNCGSKRNGPRTGNNYIGACRIHDVEMTETSLCVRINQFSSKVCWGETFNVHLNPPDQINPFLNNLGQCNFTEMGATSQIQSFTVANQNTQFYATTVYPSSPQSIPFSVSVNQDAVDPSHNSLRLLSFASIDGIDSCWKRTPKLHRLRWNDDGEPFLSDDLRVECALVSDNALSCTYRADQPGCVFSLTLWSYDDQYRISTQKQTIQIQMIAPPSNPNSARNYF